MVGLTKAVNHELVITGSLRMAAFEIHLVGDGIVADLVEHAANHLLNFRFNAVAFQQHENHAGDFKTRPLKQC